MSEDDEAKDGAGASPDMGARLGGDFVLRLVSGLAMGAIVALFTFTGMVPFAVLVAAVTVVLSFFDIEALLGFPLPDAARSTAGWWTGPVLAGDHHADAWGAAHRIAKPNLAGRTVAFDRVP